MPTKAVEPRVWRFRGGLLPLALVVVMLAAGLLAACGGSSGPSAQQVVAESARKTAALKSFHLVVDISKVPAPSAGLGLTFVNGDVAVPDRVRARIGGTFQGLPLTSDLVVIGRRFYLRNPFTHAWQTIKVSLNPVAFFNPTKGVLAVIRGARELVLDGSESVGGDACHRLRAKVPATAIAPLVGTSPAGKLLPVELWIGKDDSLLHRIRVTGPVGPGEGADATRTVELSAFDEHVEISAPTVS